MNYKQALSAPIFEIISKSAEQLGFDSYVIGGFVRDFILDRGAKKDIDIVAIGSGIELAKRVSKNLPNNPKVQIFKTYGTAMIKHEGVDLEFRPDAIDEIASQAIIRRTGARGLRSIMEESLKEVMFELPGLRNLKTVVIDRASIKDKTKPYFVYSEEKKSNSAV